ncbi:MAG: hypothetical protein ACREUG_10215, partial [Steroidobacteraceae bacterium]
AVLGTILAAASVSLAGAASQQLIAAVSVAAGVAVGSVSAPLGSAMVLAVYGDLRQLEGR